MKKLENIIKMAKTLKEIERELSKLSIDNSLNTDDMCFPSINLKVDNRGTKNGRTFYFRISVYEDEIYLYVTNDYDYSEDISFSDTKENIEVLALSILMFENM